MERTKVLGNVYGSLLVIEELEKFDKGVYLLVKCQCDCGKVVEIRKNNLATGNTKTCGDVSHKIGNNKKHGLSTHRLYWVWAGIKRRCYYPNWKSYKDYGGRGIRISDEWINNPERFIEWGLSNGYKSGLEIDRINNNGNYEPANCRWITRLMNAKNTRRGQEK